MADDTVAAMLNPTRHLKSRWAALPVLSRGRVHGRPGLLHRERRPPSIATDLGAGESSLEWVVAGYGLSFAAFLITAGQPGDEVGRRRVYTIGLGLFTVASARAWVVGPSPTTLVLARVTQGVAGDILMPRSSRSSA